jgi:type VI protein secretion system component VasK
MDRIGTELGDILWPRQSYEDIITSLKSTVATVNRDTVITGQYKELLATDYSFPVLFSQTGWDDMVAAAVADKTENLFRRNQSLKIEKPRERIAERLRAQYLTDYNRHWLTLLASIHPVPCKDLKEAALALRALTGPQSPHRELLRTVWSNLNLRMTAAELRPLSGDENGKWAEEALNALGEFVDAIDKFANATDTGRRSREVVRLQALQGIYESSWAKVLTALKVIEAPERRAAVTSAFENLVLEAQRALAVEITHEMDLLWEERIAKPFAEQLKGPLSLRSRRQGRGDAGLVLAAVQRQRRAIRGAQQGDRGAAQDQDRGSRDPAGQPRLRTHARSRQGNPRGLLCQWREHHRRDIRRHPGATRRGEGHPARGRRHVVRSL